MGMLGRLWRREKLGVAVGRRREEGRATGETEVIGAVQVRREAGIVRVGREVVVIEMEGIAGKETVTPGIEMVKGTWDHLLQVGVPPGGVSTLMQGTEIQKDGEERRKKRRTKVLYLIVWKKMRS